MNGFPQQAKGVESGWVTAEQQCGRSCWPECLLCGRFQQEMWRARLQLTQDLLLSVSSVILSTVFQSACSVIGIFILLSHTLSGKEMKLNLSSCKQKKNKLKGAKGAKRLWRKQTTKWDVNEKTNQEMVTQVKTPLIVHPGLISIRQWSDHSWHPTTSVANMVVWFSLVWLYLSAL